MTNTLRRNPRRACTQRVRLNQKSSALCSSPSTSASDSDSNHTPPSKRRSCGRRQPERQTRNDCEDRDDADIISSRHVPQRKPKRTIGQKRQKSSDNVSDASFEAPADVDSPRASDIDDDDNVGDEEIVDEISKMTVDRRSNGRKNTKKNLKATITSGKNEKLLDMKSADLTNLSEAQQSLLDSLFKAFDPNTTGRFSISDLLRVADDHGLDFTEDEARQMFGFWQSSDVTSISRDAFTQIALESKFIVPVSNITVANATAANATVANAPIANGPLPK